MTKQIILNNNLYRYSNTKYFDLPEKKLAHCSIEVKRFVVINMTEMWSDVVNWSILDEIIAIRNAA